MGVFRFIQRTEYGDLLVETSCNLGIAKIDGNVARLNLLARGSTESVLDDLMLRIADLAHMAGGTLVEMNRTA